MTSPNLSIRPICVAQDEAGLKSFLSDDDRIRLDAIRPAIESGDCFGLVSEYDGKVAGCAIVHVRYRPDMGWQPDGETVAFQHGENAYLENIEVIQGLRRQGIGRVLLAHAEAEALRREKTVLWLHTGEKNTLADRFYERNGWTHHSTVYPTWRKGAPTRIYQKELTKTVQSWQRIAAEKTQPQWDGDLDDDCTAQWAGLTLRAEAMEENDWWWCVYDNELRNAPHTQVRSLNDDGAVPCATGDEARNAAVNAAKQYLGLKS